MNIRANPRRLLLFLPTLLLHATSAIAQPDLSGDLSIDAGYDLVIRNGRVIDPASGRDEVLNVGIRGGTIETLTAAPISGSRTIDASRRICQPPFGKDQGHRG